jgi:cyclopropane fatty-acyl-phospholipid synthase-like methyltransferase
VRPDLYAAGSAYHQQRRWTHEHSVRCLETAVDLLGTPASLLDVGCAEGVHVAYAIGRGIDAMGVDIAATDGSLFGALVAADLRQPVDLKRRFEWVLCWEVAEHLPASAAETLCDTLVRHMSPEGRLLFTAAGPGQRGPGHINLAPASFWKGLFLDRGLTFAADITADLRHRWRECSPRTPWYGRNAQVYWRVA